MPNATTIKYSTENYEELMSDPAAIQIGYNKGKTGITRYRFTPSNMVFNEPFYIGDVNVYGMSVADIWHQILSGRFYSIEKTASTKDGKTTFSYSKKYDKKIKAAKGTYFSSEVTDEMTNEDYTVIQRRNHAFRALVACYASTTSGKKNFSALRTDAKKIKEETGRDATLFSTTYLIEDDIAVAEALADTAMMQNNDDFSEEETQRFFSLDPDTILPEGAQVGDYVRDGLLDTFANIVSVPASPYTNLETFLRCLPKDASALVLPSKGIRGREYEEYLHVPYYLRTPNAQTLCTRLGLKWMGDMGLEANRLAWVTPYDIDTNLPDENKVIDYTESAGYKFVVDNVKHVLESAPEGRLAVLRNYGTFAQLGIPEQIVAPIVETLGKGRMAHINPPYARNVAVPSATVRDTTSIILSNFRHYSVRGGSFDDIHVTSKGFTVTSEAHDNGVFLERTITPEEMRAFSRRLPITHENNGGIEPVFIDTKINRNVKGTGRSSEQAVILESDIVASLSRIGNKETYNRIVAEGVSYVYRDKKINYRLRPTPEYLESAANRSSLAQWIIGRAYEKWKKDNEGKEEEERSNVVKIGFIGDDMASLEKNDQLFSNIEDKSGKEAQIANELGDGYHELNPSEITFDDVRDFVTAVISEVRSSLAEYGIEPQIITSGHYGIPMAAMIGAQVNGLKPQVYLSAANEFRADVISVYNASRLDILKPSTAADIAAGAALHSAEENEAQRSADFVGLSSAWAYALGAHGYSMRDISILNEIAVTRGLSFDNAKDLGEFLVSNEGTVPVPQDIETLIPKVEHTAANYSDIVKQYAASGIEIMMPVSERLPKNLRLALKEEVLRGPVFAKGNTSLLDRPLLGVRIPKGAEPSHVRELAAQLAKRRLTAAVTLDSPAARDFVYEFISRGGHPVVTAPKALSVGRSADELFRDRLHQIMLLSWRTEPSRYTRENFNFLMHSSSDIESYLNPGEHFETLSPSRFIAIAREYRRELNSNLQRSDLRFKDINDNIDDRFNNVIAVEESRALAIIEDIDRKLADYMELAAPRIDGIRSDLINIIPEDIRDEMRAHAKAKNNGVEEIHTIINATRKELQERLLQLKEDVDSLEIAGIRDVLANLEELSEDYDYVINGGYIEELDNRDDEERSADKMKLDALIEESRELRSRSDKEQSNGVFISLERQVTEANGLMLSTVPSHLKVEMPPLTGDEEADRLIREKYNELCKSIALPDSFEMKEGENGLTQADAIRNLISVERIALTEDNDLKAQEKPVYFKDMKIDKKDEQNIFSLQNDDSMDVLDKKVRSFHRLAPVEEQLSEDMWNASQGQTKDAISVSLSNDRLRVDTLDYGQRCYVLLEDPSDPAYAPVVDALKQHFIKKRGVELIIVDRSEFANIGAKLKQKRSGNDAPTGLQPVEELSAGHLYYDHDTVYDILTLPDGMFESLPSLSERKENYSAFVKMREEFDAVAQEFFEKIGWKVDQWPRLTDANYPCRPSAFKRSVCDYAGNEILSFSFEDGKIKTVPASAAQTVLKDMRDELFLISRTERLRQEQESSRKKLLYENREDDKDEGVGPANLSNLYQEKMEQRDAELRNIENVELAKEEIERAVSAGLLFDPAKSSTVDTDVFLMSALREIARCDRKMKTLTNERESIGRKITSLGKSNDVSRDLLDELNDQYSRFNSDITAIEEKKATLETAFVKVGIGKSRAYILKADKASKPMSLMVDEKRFELSVKLTSDEKEKLLPDVRKKVDDIIKSDPKMSVTAIFQKRKAAVSTKAKADASDGKSRASRPENIGQGRNKKL